MAKKLERLREFFQGKNEEVKRGHEIIFFQLGTLSSKVNISTYYLSTSKALFGAEDEKFILFPSQFTSTLHTPSSCITYLLLYYGEHNKQQHIVDVA